MFPQVGEKVLLNPRSIGSGGEGIASLDGFVVFVDGAIPGEEVLAEVISVKKSYARARVVSIENPSPIRAKPPCPYFGNCGGCQLQHLTYSGQLEIKRQRVADALERIGKLADVSVSPCVPSDKEYGYRNKIQLPVLYDKEGVQLGLYARKTHRVVPVEHCMIHCELGEEIFQRVKTLTPPAKGQIRYVLIKTAVNRGEVLVVLITTGLDREWLNRFAHNLPVRGVVENVNRRKDNVILGDHFNLIAGDPYIEEEVCGKRFRISAHSFFQVNTEQAAKLYEKIIELAELNSEKVLVDAFCGVGSFALIAADHVKRVHGIECVKLAVEDAKANAKLNGIENASFRYGFAEEELAKIEPADVIFLNPPRKGCDAALLEKLEAETVIYMSCNPATLARDLEILSPRYRVQEVIPYDMFPQTTHVETVAKLTRCQN